MRFTLVNANGSMLLKNNFLFGLLILLGLTSSVKATTLFVDSVSGNDANSGTVSNAAWQSLAKINAKTFSPGDFLLLKNGSSWSGTMNPRGSGTNGNPIILSTYGTNAALPLINGNGNTDAVVLTNQQFWEINNLEVINPASSDGERRGIHLCAGNYGAVNHLYVSNCFVHNIRGKVDTSNGDIIAKRSGGIVVEVTTDASTATWFDDVIIQNCTITAVTNQGIVACGNRSGGSDYPGTSAWNNRNCSHLIIRNNVISDICKNAMSIRYADETCLVEHNLVHDTANGTDGNMICSYGCRGTVFQYNEGYHNNGDGLHDGSLYDADLRSPQTVWQYSYSHDNSWGLFAHYASSDAAGNPFGNDSHIIVRYNISQNVQGDIFALTGDSGAVASEIIYNNTIYTTNGLAPTFFDDRSSGHTYYAYNNVFYNLSSTASFNFTSGNTRTFDYNVFYGQHVAGEPGDAHKLISNPLLAAPGTGGGVGGTNNLLTLTGYKLQTGSPCIASGLLVSTNLTGNTNGVGFDFFGTQVPNIGQPDRGSSEWILPVTNQLPNISLLVPITKPNGATVSAQINPGNAATAIFFRFGITTNYLASTTTNFLLPGTNFVAVSNQFSGLLAGTLYHYQAVATNSLGVTNSPDATLLTGIVTPPLFSVVGGSGAQTLQFAFTNSPGASFTVLTTTNLSQARTNWTPLGSALESAPGQFQFVDGRTNSAARYYQIRSP